MQCSIVAYPNAVTPPPIGAGNAIVGIDVYPAPEANKSIPRSEIVSSAIVGNAVAPSDKFAFNLMDRPPDAVFNTPALLIIISF